ncbi:hypothetical protein MMC34_002038 [Xylographa carneopallida]|nr:hypothetical protein [Xylographa carneopallida]
MKLSGVASVACIFAACSSAFVIENGEAIHSYIQRREALDAYLHARAAWALESEQFPWLVGRAKGATVSITNSVPSSVSCVGSGYKYTSSAIKNSVEEGVDHVTAKSTTGKQKYPHIYNGNDAGVSFPACPDNRNRYEFPVQRGSVYDGDDPETDRVIFQYKSKSSAVYCGIITHANAAKRGGFVMCK